MATKQHPILFSPAMVRAILEGRKTQTRRVIKADIPAKTEDVFVWFAGSLRDAPCGCAPDGLWCRTKAGVFYLGKCPYGTPGDVLWVRETWAEVNGKYIYRADGNATPLRWKRSIHMPRRSCRLFLRVTDVRVERVQEVSEEDAVAEGVEPLMTDSWESPAVLSVLSTAAEEFQRLWDSINGKREGCSWADNPWVWAVTFERIDND